MWYCRAVPPRHLGETVSSAIDDHVQMQKRMHLPRVLEAHGSVPLCSWTGSMPRVVCAVTRNGKVVPVRALQLLQLYRQQLMTPVATSESQRLASGMYVTNRGLTALVVAAFTIRRGESCKETTPLHSRRAWAQHGAQIQACATSR